MKKLVIPVSILSLVAVGIILSLPKDEIETENTQIVQTQNKEEIKNKNKNTSSQEQEKPVEPEIVTTASTSTGEIVNPITGESHPASYYDEVLADGYTYNNPAPIPEDWIIEPATDEYPATIIIENLSNSLVVPNYPDKVYKGDFKNIEYMYGNFTRNVMIKLDDSLSINSKSDFNTWFSNYHSEYQFLESGISSEINTGKTIWSIYVDDLSVSDINNLVNILNDTDSVTIRDYHEIPLQEYLDDGSYQQVINVQNNSITE